MTRAIVQSVAFEVAAFAILFGAAGRLAWPMAWATLAVYAAFTIVGCSVLSPDLIAERTRLHPDARPADLVVAGLAFVLMFPVAFFVCGVDARLRLSPPVPEALRVLALAIFAAGYALSLWAAAVNPFFSTVVRIQAERGHHVVTTGPYAFVRHPGYAGPIVSHLFLPIALGSLWALVPSALGIACLVARIGLEERVLERELVGYRAYEARVPWRLVPGLW
jgi:protein-S-isoprenylcysteine O-methyltransferase Ste14